MKLFELFLLKIDTKDLSFSEQYGEKMLKMTPNFFNPKNLKEKSSKNTIFKPKKSEKQLLATHFPALKLSQLRHRFVARVVGRQILDVVDSGVDQKVSVGLGCVLRLIEKNHKGLASLSHVPNVSNQHGIADTMSGSKPQPEKVVDVTKKIEHEVAIGWDPLRQTPNSVPVLALTQKTC